MSNALAAARSLTSIYGLSAMPRWRPSSLLPFPVRPLIFLRIYVQLQRPATLLKAVRRTPTLHRSEQTPLVKKMWTKGPLWVSHTNPARRAGRHRLSTSAGCTMPLVVRGAISRSAVIIQSPNVEGSGIRIRPAPIDTLQCSHSGRSPATPVLGLRMEMVPAG